MINFIITVLAIGCVAVTLYMTKLASDTSSWIPTTGFIQINESDYRVIAYRVGKDTFKTSSESIVDMLASKAGIEMHLRPGASKTIINGRDPEIGKTVTVFYNPENPCQAVVEKGWSLSAIIFTICFGVPFLMRLFGWRWRSYNEYDPF